MKRRDFVIGVTLGIMLGGPAFAQDFVERITRQLRAQGFDEIGVQRTLLGRTRILAEGRSGRREIIVNPRTGEILRDLWFATEDDDSGVGIIDDRNGRGRGRGGDDGNGSESSDTDDDSSGGSSGDGGGDGDDD